MTATDFPTSTGFDPVAPEAHAGSLIPTLGGEYYYSERIFGLEQEHIFETMWFCAVRSPDLPNPGSFKTVQVGRESVLVVRGRDGALRAFLNVCRHRGAQLCTEDEGEVTPDPAVPVPRLDLRARRQARRRAEPRDAEGR